MKRREFVRTMTTAAMAVAAPRRSSWKRYAEIGLWDETGTRVPAEISALTTLYDPTVQAMATQAVEAAQRAGAQYADVHCTNIILRGCPSNSAAVLQIVKLDMSVRSLVNGYWGWSSTNTLSMSEASRVGQLSAQLATEAAARGRPRTVDLGTIPVVTNQTWETPVEIDPFSLKLTEVFDWLQGVVTYLADRGYGITVGSQLGSNLFGAGFTRTERLFASSEGSLTTQTIKTIASTFGVKYRGQILSIPGFNREIQGGWECLVRHSNDELYALVEAEREAADRRTPLSGKPADIGRYDIVYSAAAMAEILGSTLVPGTELDRALGYEANATGTSYLGPDPMKFLGTPVASSVVTVTAERSTPDALATVKWDDEGVTPQPFALVKNGVLVDYQTTREQAAWLTPWYQKQGRPVASHGCAGAPSAGFVTMQHTPNIVLEPSAGMEDEEELIAQMSHGLFVPRVAVDMDFQCSSGMGTIPGAFEIRNGKRVAVVSFSSGVLGTLFRAMDFWKNVMAVGGAKSAKWFNGSPSLKGEPPQSTGYSIRAVPALVKQQAILDPMRKA
jgi:TldD protein